MDNTILQIRHLSKSFGTHEVLKDIDFAVKKGENAELLAAFNAGLATIKGDGTYQEIIDKYMNEE